MGPDREGIGGEGGRTGAVQGAGAERVGPIHEGDRSGGGAGPGDGGGQGDRLAVNRRVGRGSDGGGGDQTLGAEGVGGGRGTLVVVFGLDPIRASGSAGDAGFINAAVEVSGGSASRSQLITNGEIIDCRVWGAWLRRRPGGLDAIHIKGRRSRGPLHDDVVPNVCRGKGICAVNPCDISIQSLQVASRSSGSTPDSKTISSCVSSVVNRKGGDTCARILGQRAGIDPRSQRPIIHGVGRTAGHVHVSGVRSEERRVG